jgi:hypothetical protein
MVAGGATFVGGALGIEMIGASVSQARGMHSVSYLAATTVEELLEMSGVALFTVALMEHLGNLGLAVRFAGGRQLIAMKEARVAASAPSALPRPMQGRPAAERALESGLARRSHVQGPG